MIINDVDVVWGRNNVSLYIKQVENGIQLRIDKDILTINDDVLDDMIKVLQRIQKTNKGERNE